MALDPSPLLRGTETAGYKRPPSYTYTVQGPGFLLTRLTICVLFADNPNSVTKNERPRFSLGPAEPTAEVKSELGRKRERERERGREGSWR